jgi:regulator of sirC expression with transglutaminase-like and TPR domain
VDLPSFAELGSTPDATIDVLSLALAAEFRTIDASAALAQLDALGAELSHAAGQMSEIKELASACSRVLGGTHGFAGDRERYDHPDNSMLDVVLSRRRGLPISLSVVYIEVARRATIQLAGVGLPGHFVVGHFGVDPPLLIDPFGGGQTIEVDVPVEMLRPWRPHEIAMRMLNNLVASFHRRGDLGGAIDAARMRLMLPAEGSLHDALEAELRALRARLN